MGVVTVGVSPGLREVVEGPEREEREIAAAVAMLRPDLAALITARLAIAAQHPPMAEFARAAEMAKRGRRMVAAMCCPECGSLKVVKASCRRGRNWWKCTEPECRKHWKEVQDAGAKRAVLA